MAFSSLTDSQAGIPSLAACLPGLHGISAFQLRLGRKQHGSWVPNDLLKGHRTSVASTVPEIPSVFSCAPLLVGVEVRPVLSVSQTDVCSVLELGPQAPQSLWVTCSSLLLSCLLGAPAQAGQSMSMLGAPFCHLHIPLAPPQGFCSPSTQSAVMVKLRPACPHLSSQLGGRLWLGARTPAVALPQLMGSSSVKLPAIPGASIWQDPLWSPQSL